VIARASGVTDDEIRRVAEGPDAPGWSAADAALLRAADELHDLHTVSDATWAALSVHLDPRQRLDLLFLVGQYVLVAGVLNALQVVRDDGVDGGLEGIPFPEPPPV
jgi:4-carboxymuconolactone decarboxylase